MSKLTLKRMISPDFNAALKKYAKRAMELYSEIAVNIVTTDEADSSTRNELRAKPFLEKLKRNLALRMARIGTWKLPKLNSVG